jgi:hypothetical protein
MMKKIAAVLLSTTSLVLPLAAAPVLVELISNVTSTSGGGIVVDNSGWVAQSFTVPVGEDLTLSDIGVSLEREGHPLARTYKFILYTDANNAPGKAVIDFGFPNFEQPAALNTGTQSVATFTLSPSWPVKLKAGKTYWIVASSTNQSQTDFFVWDTSVETPDGLAGATFGARLLSQNNGTTWVPDLGDPPLLGVSVESR